MPAYGRSGGPGHGFSSSGRDASEQPASNGATSNNAMNHFSRHINAGASFIPGLGDSPHHDTPPGVTSDFGPGAFGYQPRALTSMESQFNSNAALHTGHGPSRVPQARLNEPFSRPESAWSSATFATQPNYLYDGRDRLHTQSNPHGLYGAPGGQGSYHNPSFMPGSQDVRNSLPSDNSASHNSFGAGRAVMRIGEVDLKMPNGNALALMPEATTNGYHHGYVNGQRTSDRSLNDSLVGTRSSPTAFRLAQDIKKGLAEDPYDRSLSRYDSPPKLPNPTLGPARFKDSKMFSTADDIDSISSGVPPIHKTPRYALMHPASASSSPDWLPLALEGNMVPDLGEAFDALPLIELCRTVQPSTAGVVRVKDIPYGTTRQEMVAFAGRNSQILRQPEGAPYHAVHILMERESGKTMDCYLEVSSPGEAAWVVRQFAKRVEMHRPPKVGDRVVEVAYSSQDELMAELFPRAKHVRWSNGQPVVDKTVRRYYEHQIAAGFQGFLHQEELIAMGKHANLSDRSPFASRSPCRVYEAMITLLYKYPWYAADSVSIAERRSIYDCAIGLVKALISDLRRIHSRPNPSQATPALLQELSVAILCCVGFTEKQKATIIAQLCQGGYESMARAQGINVQTGGHHELSAVWPFYALSIAPNCDPRLMRYYSALFRQATCSPDQVSLAYRHAALYGHPMGNIKVEYGTNASTLSLAEVAKLEFDAIEKMLGRVLRQPTKASHGFSAPGTRCNSGGGSGSGSGSGSSSGAVSTRSLPFL